MIQDLEANILHLRVCQEQVVVAHSPRQDQRPVVNIQHQPGYLAQVPLVSIQYLQAYQGQEVVIHGQRDHQDLYREANIRPQQVFQIQEVVSTVIQLSQRDCQGQ